MKKAKPGYKLVKSLFGKYEEIPEEWDVKKLGEVTKIKGRVGWKGYSTEDLVEKNVGFLVLGVNNITKNNKLTLKKSTYITKKKYDESPEIKINKEDIIMASAGSVDRVAVIPSDIGPATINPNVLLIKEIQVNPFFLYYFLTSNFIKRQISKNVAATTILHVTQGIANPLKLFLPPKNEQQKIASILSNIDDLILSYENLIYLTKKLKTGVVQQLLLKGINPTASQKVHLHPKSILCEIPVDWKLIQLDSIGKIIDTPHYTSPIFSSGIPVVTTTNCHPDGVINYDSIKFTSKNEYEKRSKIINPDIDDVLFTREAPSGVAVIVDVKEVAVGQRIILIKLDSSVIRGKYLVCFLNSYFGKLQSNSFSIRTTVERINISDIKKFKIPIPSLELQDESLTIISDINNKIKKLESKKNSLDYIKKSLIQKLLMGKIRVR